LGRLISRDHPPDPEDPTGMKEKVSPTFDPADALQGLNYPFFKKAGGIFFQFHR
jgi:hypothetical protein